jgi:rhodanese-related sulfurtransferase
MSPNSAGRAEKLGYTNVKVYHEGLPVWGSKNYTVLSASFLKQAYMDNDIPHILLDVRPAAAAEKGFIKGAVTLPAAEVAANVSKFPPKDKKPPIVIYDEKDGNDAKAAAKALLAAGYRPTIMTGGMDAWKAGNLPVEAGTPSNNIVYVAKPRPGEIAIDDFRKLAESMPADTLILDVRNTEEADAGMIKGAKIVPDEEIADRFAEIPKDKKIITHCSTGVRAEMAYHKLKEKGYNVSFLNATIEIDKTGTVTKIEKP